MFSEQDIRSHLSVDGLIIETQQCVTSTNSILKELARSGGPHGYVLAAEEQTAGRGRMGRSFFSPSETGIYFSILLRPSFSPADSLLITTAAAVVCAEILEGISGQKAEIKWVNDIYINGHKVCGILTEAAIAPGGVNMDYAILGIGINLLPPSDGFPEEIKTKAGAVFEGNAPDLRSYIIAEILNRFFQLYPTLTDRSFVAEYRKRSMLDGKPVDILKYESVTPAIALYIDEDLSLVVRYKNGTIEHLSTGDVSVRME